MIRSLLHRTLLAATLGLSVTAGLARADDTPTPPGPISEADGILAPSAVTPDGVPCDAAPAKHKLWSKLWSHKSARVGPKPLLFGCYSSFNDYTCGSFRTECLWIFGSCRQWFGQRCLKGPPPSPVPGFNPLTLTYAPPGTYPPVIVPPPRKCRKCGH